MSEAKQSDSTAEFDDVPAGYQGAFAGYRADMGVVTVIFGSMPDALAYVDRLRSRWDAKQRRAAPSNTDAQRLPTSTAD